MKIGGIALIVGGAVLLAIDMQALAFSILFFLAGIALISFGFYRQKNPKYRFIKRCSSLIERYAPACREDILQTIRKKIAESALDFTGKDTEKAAHFFLMNQTAELLAGGQYHIGYGQLNPVGLAPHLKRLHDACAAWLLKEGHITQAELDEHERQLREAVFTAG